MVKGDWAVNPLALPTQVRILSPPSLSDDAAQPEQLDRGAFAELLQRADEGPVVMLNLLAFEPEGGAERYGEYGRAVMPLLEKAGASSSSRRPAPRP